MRGNIVSLTLCVLVCCPGSSYEFLDGDSRYLADVHASQWLHFVSKCIREASEIVVLLLEDDATVVLEGTLIA